MAHILPFSRNREDRSSIHATHSHNVAHNAIDVSAYNYRQKEGKEDYLLFLGRFHPNKGADVAIEVARRRGEKLVIAALPPPDNQRAYFDEKIRPYLGGQVEWIGGKGRVGVSIHGEAEVEVHLGRG